MKSVRLLPVMMLAIGALLVLKSVGLVTHGEYILTGVSVAQASGAAAEPAAPGGDTTITLPTEPTIADTSPTMADIAPTVGQSASAGHGEPAAGEHGEVAEAAPSTGHGEPAAAGEHGAPAASGEHGAAAEPILEAEPSPDGVAMRYNSENQLVPLGAVDGASASEKLLLERLGDRRTALDAQEADLSARTSLIEAAEKRLGERASTLATIEAQIAALVDQRKQLEEGQFAGIVSLYEGMKPKDAAVIFNDLDMDVLLKLAKTMNARKMSPILAQMAPARAQELTLRMVAIADQKSEQMTAQNIAELPQIVGQ